MYISYMYANVFDIGVNNGGNFPEDSLSAIYRRIHKVRKWICCGFDIHLLLL